MQRTGRLLFYVLPHYRRAGKPRPGLPSGEECCKQSDPEQLVSYFYYITNQVAILLTKF